MNLPCDHMLEETVKYMCCPKKVKKCTKADEPRCPYCPKLGDKAEAVKKDSPKWIEPEPEPEPEPVVIPVKVEIEVKAEVKKPTLAERLMGKKKEPAPEEQEPALDEDESDVD